MRRFVAAEWRQVPAFLTQAADTLDPAEMLPFLMLAPGANGSAGRRLLLPSQYVDILYAGGAQNVRSAVRAVNAVGLAQLQSLRDIGGAQAVRAAVLNFRA